MTALHHQSLLPVAAILAATLLGGCAAGLDVSPPGPQPAASAWAIERQVSRCRATQSGGTRSAVAGSGGIAVFGSVTAVSRSGTAEDCPSILALTEEDLGEVRTLTLATAASARGMETTWRSRAGARREITLSVYPVEASRGRPCRLVAATLTVYGPAEGLVGAPPEVPLDDQRFCRSPGGPWEPG